MRQLDLFTPSVKRCSKCGINKPTVEFNKHHSTRDRLNSYCRPCLRAYRKAYKSANRDLLKLKQLEYYKNNSERLSAYGKARYAENRDAIKATVKIYREKNQALIKARVKAAQRQWPYERKQKEQARKTAWLKANPDLRRGYVQLRKARIKAVAIEMGPNESKAVIFAADGLCSYCLKKCENLTLDHVVPISKGGAHSIDNVVAACMRCNQRKSAHGVLYMLNR